MKQSSQIGNAPVYNPREPGHANRVATRIPITTTLVLRKPRTIIALLMMICGFIPVSALAQSPDGNLTAYRFSNELFLGGGFTRAAIGPSLNDANFGGWNVSVTHYISPLFGVTLDTQGVYGHTSLITPSSPVNPLLYQHTFLVGPQIRLRNTEHFSSSLRVLAGVTDSGSSDTGGLASTALGLYPNATKFALRPSATFDYNLSPRFAIRVAPGVLLERQAGGFQRDFAISTGLVMRFGK